LKSNNTNYDNECFEKVNQSINNSNNIHKIRSRDHLIDKNSISNISKNISNSNISKNISNSNISKNNSNSNISKNNSNFNQSGYLYNTMNNTYKSNSSIHTMKKTDQSTIENLHDIVKQRTGIQKS